MGKRARKTVGQGTAPPAATDKRKGNDDDAPGKAICDDVLDDTFARLPARTAVASMVPSKRILFETRYRSPRKQGIKPSTVLKPRSAATMGKKRVRKTAGKDMAAARKRKSNDDDAPGAAICDDVLDNILARLPARTAVASMVLSKHHRRLICSPEFRSLHLRLSPPAPLPQPHIAYVARAPIRRGYKNETVSAFHSFHVAGGGRLKSGNAPMRTLADERYLEMKYVNTCNGILLFARQTVPPTCVLWNPAVADDEKEVTIHDTVKRTIDRSQPRLLLYGPGEYVMSIVGLGYGRRTKAYKLLLLLWQEVGLFKELVYPPTTGYSKELLVYTLGTVGEQPRRVTLLPRTMHTEMSHESLYINSTIYLPFDNKEILAFNVDNEEVTRIVLPADSKSRGFQSPVPLQLVQMSDRPCLVKINSSNITLWLLTEDHMWEQRCVFKLVYKYLSHSPTRVVWNCSGALVLYDDNNLFSYDVATKKLLKENISHHWMPKVSDYALCWGYRPTLVSPGSIVGELGSDEEGHCNSMVVTSGKPVDEQDRKNGQMTRLNTIRFMESLIPIMKRLSKTQDAV